MEQTRLMSIPVCRLRVTPVTFESEFRNLLFDLRSDGVTHGIFGEASSHDHRDWYRSMLGDVSMRALFPLWGIPPALLLEQQRRAMTSVIVSIDRSLSESYLGRSVDGEFIHYLEEAGADAAFDAQSYRTFVCASPLMRGTIVLTHAERRRTPHTVELDIDFWRVES